MGVVSNISEPQETYTLNQFISLKDNDKLTYQNYAILERSLTHPEMVYAIDNVIYTYMDEINEKKKIVTIDLDQKIKYMYKPKLLSYDIYGSTEVYFILMAMNGICNLKEFDLNDKMFCALFPHDLSSLLNSIILAERVHLNLNRKNLSIYES